MNRAALLESVHIGVDALRANPLRTLLSTTGVVIGVAALVAAFAVTDGVAVWSRELIMRESSVQDVTVSSLTSTTVRGRSVPVRGYPVLGAADAATARREIPGVVRAALTLTGRAQVEHLGRRADVLLTLSTASLADFSGLPVAMGRFFGDAEVAHTAPVLVVGQRLARELSGNRDAAWLLGRDVRVGGARRTVVGILGAPPGGEESDHVAFAPLHAASTMLNPGTSLLPVLRLKARSIEATDTLQRATLDWLAERYGRRVEKLQVSVARQQLENTRMAILLTKLLLGMLVSLILAVGGIGIMNVLLAAVSERTREIGIRKAVGARARDIQAQFLIESLAVTAIGATLGAVLGVLLAVGGTALFRHFLGSGIHAVFRPVTGALAIGAAMLVGIVFGTYPARRAAQLSPVEAIARE